MTTRVYVDRSRVEDFQRCGRKRFLTYHENGTGIEPTGKGIALVVGGATHVGLAQLLLLGQAWLWAHPELSVIELFASASIGHFEDTAVACALADLARTRIELDTTELAAMTAVGPDLAVVLAESLGLAPDDPRVTTLAERTFQGRGDFDKYLAAEQAALVEGMVRAYARRRLRPLLEMYEVMEVEREGEWKLSEWNPTEALDNKQMDVVYDKDAAMELWFMSRPDALLRDRESNQLYILSFKTTGSWDHRKERDARHDMQGLSEGVEIDLRLAAWWTVIHADKAPTGLYGHPNAMAAWLAETGVSSAMYEFLLSCAAPPRILGIRYEYLLKGDRWKDKDLTARLGVESRVQKSHLIRGYYNQAAKPGDALWNWSWDFLKEDGGKSNLYWKNWRGQPVWEYMPIRDWIDLLDASEPVMSGEDSTIGLAPRELGWKSPAQGTGYTEGNPLDAVFVTPETCAELLVYRNEDELRDWIEQVEAQERRIADGIAAVNAAGTDEGARRSALNVHFTQNRHACEYPGTCAFARDKVGVCWGGDEMKRDPVGSGEYRARTVNHPQELVPVKQVKNANS